MSETITTAILDLKPGDIVRERNADWAEPFCNGEFYDYTVEVVERINETTVHVGIAGYTGTRASISYRIDNVVSVLKAALTCASVSVSLATMHTNQAEYSATENSMGEDMTNNNDTHEMQRAPAVDQAQRRSNAYFGTAIAAVGLAAAMALGFKTGDWWISAALFAAVLVALRVESDLRNSASNEEFLGRSVPVAIGIAFLLGALYAMRSGWLTGAFSAVSAGAL